MPLLLLRPNKNWKRKIIDLATMNMKVNLNSQNIKEG